MSNTIINTDSSTSLSEALDAVAHYVDRDEVMEAFVYGVPVTALCGKIWVPSRDGDSYKICQTCEEIYSQLS